MTKGACRRENVLGMEKILGFQEAMSWIKTKAWHKVVFESADCHPAVQRSIINSVYIRLNLR